MGAKIKNLDIASSVIKHRDVRFKFEDSEVQSHWVKNDPWLSHFFNGLFFMVPEGERWVINSARNQLPKITDPDLVATVKAFIRQEATHSREHDIVNRIMIANGLPADKLEIYFSKFMKQIQKYLSDDLQASIAAGIEHLNAVLSEVALDWPELFEDMDPKMRALVLWHLVEEAEHKSVFMDIINSGSSRGLKGYILRTTGLVLPIMFETSLIFANMFYLLAKDGEIKNSKSMARFVKYLFLKPGLAPRMISATSSYFIPNFHPWDRDNRELINIWKDNFERTHDAMQAGDALLEWVVRNK